MAKKLSFSLLIIFFVCFSACQEGKDLAQYKEFTKVYYPAKELDRIPISTKVFIANRMIVSNDFLFILSPEKDTVVRVFDNQTLEYLGGFGTQGEGPDEFFHPYQDGFRIYEHNTVSMVDRVSIRKIDFNFLKGGKSFPHNIASSATRYKLPGLMIPLREGAFLNDSTIIGLNQPINDQQFIQNNLLSNEITHFGQYPAIELKMTLFEKKDWLGGFYRLTPDHSQLVMVYGRIPLLRIISVKDSAEVSIKTLEQPLYSHLADKDGNMSLGNGFSVFYHDMTLSDHLIFAYYWNYKIIYSSEGKATKEYFSDKEIHVFDMMGNPMYKLILEDWMSKFTVLLNSEYIFFLHPEDESAIYRYKLPNVE